MEEHVVDFEKFGKESSGFAEVKSTKINLKGRSKKVPVDYLG